MRRKFFRYQFRFFSLVVLLAVVGISIFVAIAPNRGELVWEHTRIASLATAFAPQSAELRFKIGNYYFGGGAYDTDKAMYYYHEALELDPFMQGPRYQIARIYFVRGNFNMAEIEINKELSQFPDFKRSYYVRGLIYGYTGRLAEAERDFKTFLEWKPESWAGLNDLAWIYFQAGKFEETRDAAKRGLKIAPDNPWLLNALGVALLNIGDKIGAQEALSHALIVAGSMNEKDWGMAYPGNDPRIYDEGLLKMKDSIKENLNLLSAVDSRISS